MALEQLTYDNDPLASNSPTHHAVLSDCVVLHQQHGLDHVLVWGSNFSAKKAWIAFIVHEESAIPHVHVCVQRATPTAPATEIQSPNAAMRIMIHSAYFQSGTPVFTLHSVISEKPNAINAHIAE
ncbi:uncharacterized protein EI90DRAFT_3011177 [Cantharellus anzutake]|uniref:uncharacterized protein n=1 Tax=Cantharellus anzutake TaxID=1750568 RepID=UPI0019040B98|nr:uncharacterized protein EI90DRAFT_3011177 [Cantharellus anzutake]KAF8342667.1 hypothetical protein EI90DRAFT_3011177 [Cantharellus anzutake]